MPTKRTSSNEGENRIVAAIKGTALFLVLTVIGYVAIGVAHNTLPLPNAISGFAPIGAMVSMEAATEANTSETQPGAGTALAAEPARSAPSRSFDYFPDHYVNQATTVEEPAPTF